MKEKRKREGGNG